MLAFLLTVFYSLIILACQIFNNTTIFASALIIHIGLLACSPIQNIGPIQSIIMYCFIGSIFDSLFQFLPFGFTTVFLLASYALQKAFNHPTNTASRILSEQLTNIAYILSLFIFREVSFATKQFLLTTILSQLFVLITSKAVLRISEGLAVACDNYIKYK